MKLVTRVEDNSIILSIYSKNGTLLYSENTEISDRHRWNIKWHSNKRIILHSSDIGYTEWMKQSDGSWEKGDPLEKISPDGKLIISWYSGEGRVAITIYDINEPTNALYNTKTDIQVSELIDCLEWDGNDRFILKADDGLHYWEKQLDDTWKKVD